MHRWSLMCIAHGDIEIQKQVSIPECVVKCNEKKRTSEVFSVYYIFRQNLSFIFFYEIIFFEKESMLWCDCMFDDKYWCEKITRTIFCFVKHSNTLNRHHHLHDGWSFTIFGVFYHSSAHYSWVHIARTSHIIRLKYLLFAIQRNCLDLFDRIGNIVYCDDCTHHKDSQRNWFCNNWRHDHKWLYSLCSRIDMSNGLNYAYKHFFGKNFNRKCFEGKKIQYDNFSFFS